MDRWEQLLLTLVAIYAIALARVHLLSMIAACKAKKLIVFPRGTCPSR